MVMRCLPLLSPSPSPCPSSDLSPAALRKPGPCRMQTMQCPQHPRENKSSGAWRNLVQGIKYSAPLCSHGCRFLPSEPHLFLTPLHKGSSSSNRASHLLCPFLIPAQVRARDSWSTLQSYECVGLRPSGPDISSIRRAHLASRNPACCNTIPLPLLLSTPPPSWGWSPSSK